MDIERCQICDEPTERAGALDDSIYVSAARDFILPNGLAFHEGDDIGPLCEDCYHDLEQAKHIQQD